MMRYENIFIRDFGILNNSELNNLNPNFNIIGGGNRAGKTTLLKVLRYIGYGIPKSNELPPARSRYGIEAILADKKNRYNLLIEGYANPKVNIINDVKFAGQNIFSEVDRFTYKQIFTITLEELKRLPKGVSDKEKLQAVLMGAGLKEYILLPKLQEYFASEAKSIGGEYGKINVSRFKEYNQNIQEGIELKKEAKTQVKEYYDLKSKYKKIQNKIDVFQNRIKDKQQKKNRLDLIKSNYEKINEMINIKEEFKKEKYSMNISSQSKFYPQKATELHDEYKKINNEIKELSEDFQYKSGNNFNEVIQIQLLNAKNKIDLYYNDISGLRERFKNINEKRTDLNQKLESLKNEAFQLSEEIAGNLKILENLDANIEYKNYLRKHFSNFEELEIKIKAKKDKIEQINRNIELKKDQINKLKKDSSTSKNHQYILFLSILFTIVISSLVFIDVRFAWLFILDAIFIYKSYINHQRKEQFLKEKNIYENELESYKSEKKILKEELKNDLKNKNEVEKVFDELTKQLKLEGDIQPSLLKEYYEDLLDLKAKYIEYKDHKKKFMVKENKFETEINKIYNFLSNFKAVLYLKKITENNLYEYVEDLIKFIEDILEYKDLVQDIKNKANEKKALKDEIIKLDGMDYIEKKERGLYTIVKDYKDTAQIVNEYRNKKEKLKDIESNLTNITEQMKNAFEINSKLSDEEIVLKYIKEYNKYFSYENISEEYESITKEMSKLADDLEKKKNKKEKIKFKMDDLSTEEKLIKAENKINKARQNLKPLAEKYAANKLAANLLNKYWVDFINKKKERLLNKAGKIISKITSDKYNKIEPLDNFKNINFKVQEKNGRTINNTDYLSRGTREQLYMAIRINRIMEIKPCLPVIIDDSLVNYDPKHLKNIFEIINNLKNRNQIFYLTCHPEQIEYLNKIIDNKNFYYLNNGKFKQVNKSKLIKNLI